MAGDAAASDRLVSCAERGPATEAEVSTASLGGTVSQGTAGDEVPLALHKEFGEILVAARRYGAALQRPAGPILAQRLGERFKGVSIEVDEGFGACITGTGWMATPPSRLVTQWRGCVGNWTIFYELGVQILERRGEVMFAWAVMCLFRSVAAALFGLWLLLSALAHEAEGLAIACNRRR